MASAHWHISMLACVLYACTGAASQQSTKGGSIVETLEAQPPIARIIDLERKAQGAAESNPCPDKGVNPGDTLTWKSERIRDKQNVVVTFAGDKHPFKESPKLEGNLISNLDQAPYSYEIREGETLLGCGNIRPPGGPPDMTVGETVILNNR